MSSAKRRTCDCTLSGKSLTDNTNKIGPKTDPREPALVAQLDARLTGDQEVVGSTPAEVGNILSWRLIMKSFLQSLSPFR